MVSTVSNQGYGSPVWGSGPDYPPSAWGVEAFLLRLLNSRAFWIALMILGFIAWWPIGLALLLFLIGSGRMGCGHYRRHGGRYGNDERGRGWHGWAGPWASCAAGRDEERRESTSGNRAFDEYRAETLRRLEDEQREFAAFLDRLRFAKDKAEFDAFMDARRQPPPSDAPAAEPTA